MPSKSRSSSFKVRIDLSYDGTRFAGWQRQKNARSIQETLEQTFHKILGERIRVIAAGRTDSGVHAQGQVAHATLHSLIQPAALHRALNALLPEEILIQSLKVVGKDFHARYGAKAKRYRYTIWNCPLRPLWNRHQVLHVPAPLDSRKMRSAARLLVGRHDFGPFHSSGRVVSSTIRHLRSLTIRQKKETILIEAEADGFLYHMVRRMVGLLLEIGKGRYSPSTVRTLLSRAEKPASDRRQIIPPTAPAKGLCLVEVRY